MTHAVHWICAEEDDEGVTCNIHHITPSTGELTVVFFLFFPLFVWESYSLRL